ncbi:YdcF family protein [Maribellus sp. YY47]|uniref:YdcF family protein n=1 Tax=Maribellus sp. YY47 TaxID=2929486 RepID=UPI002000A7A2|nr:YdcF family protein [Maribellus sp. YY47]MCK3685020.1 YdcF family protein [Maribellus sp. YY47]
MICIVLALTSAPYRGYHWLGTSQSKINQKPQYIILLGGGGMPSQSNLMRSWYTAVAVKSFPEAKVVIAMPGELEDSMSTPQKMKAELEVRAIAEDQILFEARGTNTSSQALNCAGIISYQTPILLITSLEHMRRAVFCFRKVGYEKVNALPAFENVAEADFAFNDDELGGNTIFIPDVGQNINVRYKLWNHLKYEILFVREMFALSYYKLRGWI